MTLPAPMDPNLGIWRHAQWFTADSFMNARLGGPGRGGLGPLDPNSSPVVAKLAAWVHGQPQSIGTTTFTPGIPWISTTFNVWKADPARLQKVTLVNGWALQAQQQPLLSAVPVPDAAVGNATPDRSLTITDNVTIYEFWEFVRDATTKAITAQSAGIIKGQAAKLGVYGDDVAPPVSSRFYGSLYGVQASGFSQLAGLTTLQELADGWIPHVTSFSVPWARATWYSAPAQRTDGQDTAANSIPYGSRFMLAQSFDPAAYETQRRTYGWNGTPEPTFRLGRFAKIVIEAWKCFGAVPVDQTGSGVALNVENPTSCRQRTGSAPALYNSLGQPSSGTIFDAQPDAIMRQLPWEQLRLAQLDLRRRV